MRLPQGRQVPFTAGMSGIVLVAALSSIGTPLHELVIFGAWGLVFLIESFARDAYGIRRHLLLPEVRAAVLSAVLLLGAVLAQAAHAPRPLLGVLYAGCYLTAGWSSLWTGLRAARRKSIDVELLMVLAALCAAGTGRVFDGGLLFVIFTTSQALAAVATRRTQESVRSLLTLAPEHAIKIMSDGRGELVPAASLVAADEVLVRPGDRIGADGEVLSGTSDVDQASITGEPLPVSKRAGDEVFAGTVNGVGVLRIRVTRSGAESVVARIVAQVERASATKARTQVVLEQIERRYSVGVVVATAAILLVPFALGTDFKPALLRAMSFMIVASPCALTLATMPALLAAIANAGRHGVLVKGAAVMERLGKVTTVAFDKTGSLTLGAPQVVDVVALPGRGLDADELVRFAAAAERASEHPLAEAVLAEAAARALVVPEAQDFRAEPGRGVHAEVAGRQVTVASPSMFLDADDSDMVAAVRAVEDAGSTALIVVVDGRPIGVLALIDQLRPEAARTIDVLRTMTDDEPVVLTGDGLGAANQTGKQAGIREIRAQLLPADKVSLIGELQAAGKRVTYVGDGINDAPALMTADVGVAMAHGADLALETADVVLVRGNLASLPAMIKLSQRAGRVVIQNLILAATVVVALVVIDLVSTLPLPLAVAGHEGSTLVVALNGLRLLRAAVWRDSPRPAREFAAADLRRHLIAAASFLALGVWVAYQL
jgi:heavy metal translocating P-type ATPase